jgi:thymidylate kinase
MENLVFEFPYQLLIVGTVGAGKTTICNYLSEIFKELNIKYNLIPEFASSELGMEILKGKLSGKLSAYTLQHYVLDFWNNYVVCDKKNEIYIYDRCPDDSVLCFCNIWNKQGIISDIGMMNLYQRAKDMSEYFPNYDGTYEFTEMVNSDFDSTVSDIIDIIYSDKINMNHKRIIGLSVTDDESWERIQERNRDGESAYDMKDVVQFNKHYRKLYKYINRKQKRFLDMGRLL